MNLETKGIILEKGSNIIVKNYFTDGVETEYKNNAGILESFMRIKFEKTKNYSFLFNKQKTYHSIYWIKYDILTCHTRK